MTKFWKVTWFCKRNRNRIFLPFNRLSIASKDAFLSVSSEGYRRKVEDASHNFSRIKTPASPVVSLAITYLGIKTPLACYLLGIVPVACHRCMRATNMHASSTEFYHIFTFSFKLLRPLLNISVGKRAYYLVIRNYSYYNFLRDSYRRKHIFLVHDLNSVTAWNYAKLVCHVANLQCTNSSIMYLPLLFTLTSVISHLRYCSQAHTCSISVSHMQFQSICIIWNQKIRASWYISIRDLIAEQLCR